MGIQAADREAGPGIGELELWAEIPTDEGAASVPKLKQQGKWWVYQHFLCDWEGKNEEVATVI